MEVILREDVPGLGIIGDVVRVKPGFARNYLLPRGMAVAADRRNLKQLEHHKRVIEAKAKRERSSHEAVARAMEGLTLETEARAGRGGKLFGSVTNIDIQRLLKEEGFDFDRRRIELKEHIKEIGEYSVTVRVGQDIRSIVKILVNPLGGELEDKSVDGEEEAPPEREAAPEASSEEAGDGDGETAAESEVDSEARPSQEGDAEEHTR